MIHAVIITGSPNPESRLNGILEYVKNELEKRNWFISQLRVSSLPSEDLIFAKWDSPSVQEANKLVENADVIIVASPVYKAAYSGVLKTYLDLIPEKGLDEKLILPLFIGGTMAHLMTIDYSLKPIMTALGARHISRGVSAFDTQVEKISHGQYKLSEKFKSRLDNSIGDFADLTECIVPTKVSNTK